MRVNGLTAKSSYMSFDEFRQLPRNKLDVKSLELDQCDLCQRDFDPHGLPVFFWSLPNLTKLTLGCEDIWILRLNPDTAAYALEKYSARKYMRLQKLTINMNLRVSDGSWSFTNLLQSAVGIVKKLRGDQSGLLFDRFTTGLTLFLTSMAASKLQHLSLNLPSFNKPMAKALINGLVGTATLTALDLNIQTRDGQGVPTLATFLGAKKPVIKFTLKAYEGRYCPSLGSLEHQRLVESFHTGELTGFARWEHTFHNNQWTFELKVSLPKKSTANFAR